ncbi:allophanate hydrolase subunit 1 [Lysobacter sp. TY2-98]|uniref:5-oxoprolinase subunit PxpB n=1 Tax=Lysobacter sp. TY2-98 TaxID=2290922 RepID=UPI000E1FEE88|nr:5-oxoprolinase subunit PxpB [Lysobacter sp. TY2-98]AXK71941.1 allophanate hydrolase subunit 1 [Lysobacter sp. TY2-98]
MDWRIGRLGDAALLIEFDGGIDAATNARVHALANAMTERRVAWIAEVVPAYASVAIHVNEDAFDRVADPLADAEHRLHGLLRDIATAPPRDRTPRCVEIPVHYGGEHGPDLHRVADSAGLTVEDAVARHAAGDYTVAMLGFAPGFPYLLGLDPQLSTPRLDSPRTRVPAGSVAIGGAQTGLYPHGGPGGWNLIGRTDLVLFDARRDPPALLMPGDHVRFVAVSGA